MTQAVKDDKKITIALEKRPIPKSMIITGIHAIPGIGLTRSKRGLIKRSAFLLQAMIIPRGTPITTPMRYPLKATCKEAARCCNMVPPSGRVS
jgi:hypothetical protein